MYKHMLECLLFNVTLKYLFEVLPIILYIVLYDTYLSDDWVDVHK